MGTAQNPEFEQNILLAEEPDEAYDVAEENLLRTALKRTHKERFLIMTSLMKDGQMMKRAKITYKKDSQ